VLRYQSDLTDALTGQVDMGARLYEPALGRFSSMDPLFGELTDPLSLNPFVYGMVNPLTYSDPTGLCAIADCPPFTGTGDGGLSVLPASSSWESFEGANAAVEWAEAAGGGETEALVAKSIQHIVETRTLPAISARWVDALDVSQRTVLTAFVVALNTGSDVYGSLATYASGLGQRLRSGLDPGRQFQLLGRVTRVARTLAFKALGVTLIGADAVLDYRELVHQGMDEREALARTVFRKGGAFGAILGAAAACRYAGANAMAVGVCIGFALVAPDVGERIGDWVFSAVDEITHIPGWQPEGWVNLIRPSFG